jgi:hypothetical protein
MSHSDITSKEVPSTPPVDITKEYKPEAVQLEYGQVDAEHHVEFIGRQLGTLRAYDDAGRIYLNPQPSSVGLPPVQCDRKGAADNCLVG